MAATERSFQVVTHDKDGRVIGGLCGTWATLDSDDYGSWVRVAHLKDKSIQIQGTPGAGGKLKVQGYNGANPADGAGGYLTNDGSTEIELTTAGDIAHIAEHVVWIRPIAVGGDGTTALTVTLLAGR